MSEPAWGYVRISQESDASLEEQKESIRKYARENGFALQTTRNEGTNTSGFNEDRHEYQLLLDKIDAADIDAVITRDRARLSRDFDERLRLISLFRETGVEWHVIEAGGKLELQNVERAGMECLHAMMDHVKKMTEIERSKKAVQKRIERGCYQGTPPAGMDFADDNCHLVTNDEWENVARAFEMLDEGHTYSEIGDETGFSKWKVSKLKKRGKDWYLEQLEEYGK